MQVKYCILGYHPANNSHSIVKYFDFYRRNLPRVLGCGVSAFSPGHLLHENDLLPIQGKGRTWAQNYLSWPAELIRLKSECFHIVDQGLVWYSRFLRGGRRLGTVHDLIAYMTATRTLALPPRSTRAKLLIRENARQMQKLDHIISVSRFTADALVRELNIPSSRITVVPNHVDQCFSAPSPSERTQKRRKWFGTAPFAVIHVGRPLVYKNRLGVIKSFALLWRRMPEARLFLVGGACTREERAFIDSGEWSTCIGLIPAVTNAELREIYGAADTLIFPSYYEGFGWPPIEAMACGCPVVSSTRASLREVVGDASLTVEDPDDHERISGLVFEILQNSQVANELRRKGLARAQLFSPDRALNAVADIYRHLA